MTEQSLNAYPVIGMSPGNSYFKEDTVTFLLKKVIKKFGKAAVLIPDVPAIATYIALGYPENRARRDKAIPKGNALKNLVRKVTDKLNYPGGTITIIDWEQVETNPGYQQSYQKISTLYHNNQKFREAIRQATKDVLLSSEKDIPDIEKGTDIAVHYILSEFAFLEFAPELFNTQKVAYIYHKHWKAFEQYISGKLDGIKRPYLDFLIIKKFFLWI